MITYSEIGHFGRLGNQMFQFASTIGIARKLGYDVYFPIENITEPTIENFKDGITRSVYFDIPKIFDIPNSILKSRKEFVDFKNINEPQFHFCYDMFNIPDNVNLKGYYQTEKYFDHCQEEIRSIFTFKNEIKNTASQIISKLDYELVSIHVRVGDYIGLQDHHPICEPEYYGNAIKHFMDKNYYFLIFSDSIEYSKNIFGESENIIYIEGNTQEVDMCLMSMCHHNIIANSTFSWWAAWLNNNPDKKVIAPKKWFGSAYSYQDTSDLYCKNWIIN